MSYCQYQDAFQNNENDKLDQMARQINNKKKIYKKNRDNFNNHIDTLCDGVECLSDPSNSRFVPPHLSNNFSFFSSQGDFSSELPTPLEHKKKRKKKRHFDVQSSISGVSSSDDKYHIRNSSRDNSSDEDFGKFSDNNTAKFSASDAEYTADTNDVADIKDFSTTLTDISSNFSSLPNKLKKQFRSTSDHLKKYKDDNETDILNHVTQCKECALKLEGLLKQVTMETNTQLVQPPFNQNNSSMFNFSEMKDLLILVLIGVFIIIIIDAFIRK